MPPSVRQIKSNTLGLEALARPCGQLRAVRVGAGLSQQRLVDAMIALSPRLPGIEVANVAHWENGRRVPGIAQMHCYLSACGASDEAVVDLVHAFGGAAALDFPGSLAARSSQAYSVLSLRWRENQLTAAEARANWEQVAPLVPTSPKWRQ